VGGGAIGLSILPASLAAGTEWRRAQRLAALVGDAIGFGLLLLWSGVVSLLLRRRFARARTWVAAAPWRTTGLGILALTGGLFAVVMAIVLLALTLVGLPLSLLLAACLVLLLLVAMAFGVARIGEVVCRALGLGARSGLLPVVAGVLTLALPQIGADILRLTEWGSGGGLRALYACLQVLALAAGLGALVLSRLGSSPYLVSPARPGLDVGRPA
jgi:hypothetical protein